jgi:hypothetical protein
MSTYLHGQVLIIAVNFMIEYIYLKQAIGMVVPLNVLSIGPLINS